MRSPPAAAWRRNGYVMAAAVFVVFSGFAFVLPFLPLFVRELGVRDDGSAALWAGVLIGVSPLLAGGLAPVWGHLGDRYGQKRMALRALAAYVVLLALGAAVRSVADLLVLRIGVGLFGGIGPLGLSMATAQAPREETGRAVGLVQAAQILAAAVGPFAGGVAAHFVGFRGTFVAAAAVCLAAFLLVLLLYRDSPSRSASSPSSAGASFKEILRLRRVPFLLGTLFLVNFVGRSFTPILPLHLRELGVAPDRLAVGTGLLISAYAVSAAASAAGLGRLSRRVSPALLLAWSLLAGAVFVFPMARVPTFPPLLLLAMLLGLASGGALTLCYTLGGRSVPSETRATAYGFFSGAALFGGAISPSIAGLLAHYELRAIYYVNAAIFVVLAAAVALRATSLGAVDTSRSEAS